MRKTRRSNIPSFLLFLSVDRKFADIEAANQRLASALYLKEEGENISQEPDTLEQPDGSTQGADPQDPGKSIVHTAGDGKSPRDASFSSCETEMMQPEEGHLWRRHPKSQTAACDIRENNRSEAGQDKESKNGKVVEMTSMSSTELDARCHPAEPNNSESSLMSANYLSEDFQITRPDSGLVEFAHSVDPCPVFSPENLFTLDSYDFSIQMFPDTSAGSQAQKDVTDISEDQWTDIMDIFSTGDENGGEHVDVEAYFESICAYHGDSGQQGSAVEFGCVDPSDSFTEEIGTDGLEGEYQHCNAGEYKCEDGCSRQGVQGLTADCVPRSQRQNNDAAVMHRDNLKTFQAIIQNQLPTSVNYQYDISELQVSQPHDGRGSCLHANNHNLTPFEGVAQSFTVPLYDVTHHAISTPPHEDDWPFTDILKDRTSPYC